MVRREIDRVELQRVRADRDRQRSVKKAPNAVRALSDRIPLMLLPELLPLLLLLCVVSTIIYSRHLTFPLHFLHLCHSLCRSCIRCCMRAECAGWGTKYYISLPLSTRFTTRFTSPFASSFASTKFTSPFTSTRLMSPSAEHGITLRERWALFCHKYFTSRASARTRKNLSECSHLERHRSDSHSHTMLRVAHSSHPSITHGTNSCDTTHTHTAMHVSHAQHTAMHVSHAQHTAMHTHRLDTSDDTRDTLDAPCNTCDVCSDTPLSANRFRSLPLYPLNV